MLREIIEEYQHGTDYSSLSYDFLLEAKSGKYSLTWMDARVDGKPTTPRNGRCVEVNALWYNALRSVEELSKRLGEDPEPYVKLSSNVQSGFNKVFWNSEGNYLYDCVGDEEEVITPFAPNQIFSMSLPFPVLRHDRWSSAIPETSNNSF